MNQKITLSIVLMGIVLVAGCTQNSNTYDINSSKSDFTYEEIAIGCLPGLMFNSVSFVVRNQNEYNALLVEYYEKTKEEYKVRWGVTTDDELNKGMPFKDCDAKLTPIDFEKYTLLSHYAEGSGCTTEFNKNVQINHNNKKVIFTIDVIEHGTCEPWQTHRASILIPRISNDYTVDFKVSGCQIIRREDFATHGEMLDYMILNSKFSCSIR